MNTNDSIFFKRNINNFSNSDHVTSIENEKGDLLVKNINKKFCFENKNKIFKLKPSFKKVLDPIDYLTIRFSKIRKKIIQDIEGSDSETTSEMCSIIENVMALATPPLADKIIVLLLKMSCIVHNASLLGLIFNNLGCVEKIRGNNKMALQYLKMAAEKEGGIASASPTTLSNISALYIDMKMFVEAAEISKHASLRCEINDNNILKPSSLPTLVQGAILYNLASALLYGGELEKGAATFENALKILDSSNVPKNCIQYKSTIKAKNESFMILRRNMKKKCPNNKNKSNVYEDAISDESIFPINKDLSIGVAEKDNYYSNVQKKINNELSEFNNSLYENAVDIKEKNSFSKGVMHKIKGPNLSNFLALSSISKKVGDSSKNLNPIKARPCSCNNNIQTTREKSFCFDRPFLNDCYNLGLRRIYKFPLSDKTTYGINNPVWDSNSFINQQSRKPLAPLDPELVYKASKNYVPSKIAFLILSFHYKENSKRNKIISKYKYNIKTMKLQEEICRLFISEDEERVDIEIQAQRERKTILHYIRGYFVFVSYFVNIVDAENEERTFIIIEKKQSEQLLFKALKQIYILKQEEINRNKIIN